MIHGLVSNTEKGYMVKQVIHTDTGLEIPLVVIPSSPIYGKTIHHLVVEIDFDTSERLHVTVNDRCHTVYAEREIQCMFFTIDP